MSTIKKVEEFHIAFSVPVWSKPVWPGLEREQLRIDLIEEELKELKDAIKERDMVGVLDALVDLNYVIDGTFLEFGLGDIKKAAFNEVHRSNMSKLDEDGNPVLREDGKVLKSKLYRKPDLKRLMLYTQNG